MIEYKAIRGSLSSAAWIGYGYDPTVGDQLPLAKYDWAAGESPTEPDSDPDPGPIPINLSNTLRATQIDGQAFPLLLNRSPTTCVGVKEDNFIENLHVVFLDEQSEPWERDRFALVMRIVTESRRCWGDMVQWADYVAFEDSIITYTREVYPGRAPVVTLSGFEAGLPLGVGFDLFGHHSATLMPSDSVNVLGNAVTVPEWLE